MASARLASYAVIMLAFGCDEVVVAPESDEPLPGATLPSGAPGALGPYLPTARGAGSRIPVTVLEPRGTNKADAGIPTGSGQGVPL